MDFQQKLKKVLQKQRDLVKAAIPLHIPPAALNFWTSLGGLPQKFGTLLSPKCLGALQAYDLGEGILEAYVKTTSTNTPA